MNNRLEPSDEINSGYPLATGRPTRPATALTFRGAASQIAGIEIRLQPAAIQNAIE